jgi:hypothetical protein
MLSQTCARRELSPFVAAGLASLPVRRSGPARRNAPVRRGGFPSAATLAWSEPLTALPRSARSRVSSSRSLCKAAYGNPLRLPSECNAELVIIVAPQSAHVGITARERAERSLAWSWFSGRTARPRRSVVAAAQNQRPRILQISSGRRGVSSEGHPQQEPVVWARQRAPTAGVRGHCPEEDTLTDH